MRATVKLAALVADRQVVVGLTIITAAAFHNIRFAKMRRLHAHAPQLFAAEPRSADSVRY